MKADADLDNQVNPATWGQTGTQTFEEAVQIMLDEYVGPRRDLLYNTQVVPDTEDARSSSRASRVTLGDVFCARRRVAWDARWTETRILTTAVGRAAPRESDSRTAARQLRRADLDRSRDADWRTHVTLHAHSVYDRRPELDDGILRCE